MKEDKCNRDDAKTLVTAVIDESMMMANINLQHC